MLGSRLRDPNACALRAGRLSTGGRARLDALADIRASIARRLDDVVGKYRHLGERSTVVETVAARSSAAVAAAAAAAATTPAETGDAAIATGRVS